MYAVLAIIAGVALVWGSAAALHAQRRGLSFHQSFLFVPFKLLHRIDEKATRNLRSDPPVIYAVLHQSRLDPALMLSLLPQDTLHILDEASSRSLILEPWREMARTIAFNAKHVFVSRRLVRHLKGRGRLAVYFPDGIEPETRPYRLYRAVARIAAAAGARVVPVSVQGSRRTPFSLGFVDDGRRSLLAKLKVVALEPLTMEDLMQLANGEQTGMASALHARVRAADGA